MRVSTKHSSEAGSTVVVVLVVILVTSMAITSYLRLTTVQNHSIIRSQVWNSALPLAEAGLEEAMSHLNKNDSNLATDGWVDTGNEYLKQHFIGDGSFEVTISKDSDPVIKSTGFAALPPSMVQSGGSDFIPRTIEAVATTSGEEPGIFCHGIVALEDIDLNGNNVRTDSFDSTDPLYSTGGAYDPLKFKDGGDIATNSGLVNSISVGNANIFGKASTGPDGSVACGSNGCVGSMAWHAAGNSGIQPGWSNDDMNVQFPDVEAPWAGGAGTPFSGTINGENYEYVFGTGNWDLSSFSLSGPKKAIVTGDAKVYVHGNFSMSGQSELTIQAGASLELFVGGSSASLGGNGVINENEFAGTFHYYGLPGNTSVTVSGNGSFTGVIYAPEAALTMNGAGNNNYDVVGASVSESVTMNGHVNFHFDEALCEGGPSRGYLIESWMEVATAP